MREDKVAKYVSDAVKNGFEVHVSGIGSEYCLVNHEGKFSQWSTISLYPGLPEGHTQLEIYHANFYVSKAVPLTIVQNIKDQYNLA